MKKNLFFAALAITALVSCSESDYLGDEKPSSVSSGDEVPISFTSGAKAITRAIEGGAAAELLGNNFVLYGTKGETPTTVFNNYQANYVTNSANTTESNSSNWEYVSYYNVPGGVKTNVGVTAFSETTGESGNVNIDKITQTIKYWDYATTQYDFAAYSLGKGVEVTPATNPKTYHYATASTIDASSKSFTLTGSADELKACYISDLVTKYNKQAVTADPTANPPVEASPAANEYGSPVQFSFRSLAAKVRIAFYETIPGYSVRDVKFYTSSTATTTQDVANTENAPTLFTSSAVLPSGSGTMTITYPTTGWGNRTATDYNKAHIAFAATDNATDLASTLTFGALTNYPTTYEGVLNSGDFIGRTSNTATYADGGVTTGEAPNTTFTPNAQGTYYTILPYETGANLQLRIKYTLQATDGYGETITVDNATAVVPAEFAQWNPNYAYTYIFKISDMTNGSTGTDGNNNIVYGLTPITLDAVVVESETGVQETITTVADPSITTYMAGKVVTDNDEYKVYGSPTHPIYIVVNNGTSNVALNSGTNNAKLYIATVQNSIQGITEETVDNALRYGVVTNEGKTFTVTDATGGTLALTEVGAYDANNNTGGLKSETAIPATESPTGNAVTLNCASFVPTAGTTYVFQYKGNTSAAYGVYAAVAPATLENGKKYYTSDAGAGEFTAAGTEKVTTSPRYYTQKISYSPVTGTLPAAGTYYYYDSSTSNYVDYSWNGTDEIPVQEGGYFTQVTSYEAVPFATLTAGTTYYTSDRGAGKFKATGSEVVDAENKYYTETSPEGDAGYMYKIIKVAAAQ